MQLTNPLISATETQAMINARADVNAIDKYGRTPLDYAKREKKRGVVKYLESLL